MSRLNQVLWLLLGTLGTVVTFVFSYRFILCHYERGPYVHDSAWFSYAIFQHGLVLPNLPHFQGAVGGSLYTQHVYALPAVLTPLSYAASSHHRWFATYLGATYALMFLGPFLAVRALRTTLPWAFAAAAVGLCVAFSGAVLAAIGYPHFEMAIPGLFIVFLALHFLGLSRLKWVALAAGLLVREDAGLHYVGYCAIIGAYQWWKKLEPVPRRTLITTLAASLLASATILFIQRTFFPLGDSMFHKSYVGDPPFAQLADLGQRLSGFGHDASHLYGPAVLILLAAAVLRAPAFAIGYVAALPWVVVNIVFSLTPAARTLSLYYGFPLMVGMVWPLLAPHWMPEQKRGTLGVPLVAAAALLSLFLLGNFGWLFRAARDGANISSAAYLRYSDCLAAEWARSPGLYADTTVAALFPHVVPANRMLWAPQPPPDDAEGFVFFENDKRQFYREQAKQRGIEHEVEFPLLAVRLRTRTPAPLTECLEAR